RAGEHQRLAYLRARREQLERAAAVGLGAVATAAGLGHGVVAAVLGRCPEDIRRPQTVRGRAGMPSTARSESFEAVDCTALRRRRSPGEQARRHRRGRAWPVVPLALEKGLFLNVRRKCLLVPLAAKSFAISTNGLVRSESRRGRPLKVPPARPG